MIALGHENSISFITALYVLDAQLLLNRAARYTPSDSVIVIAWLNLILGGGRANKHPFRVIFLPFRKRDMPTRE